MCNLITGWALPKILNHPPGSIVPGGTANPAAGMGAGGTVKIPGWCAIPGGFWMRPQAEQLMQIMAPVENIGFGQAVNPFQALKAQLLATDNELLLIDYGSELA